MLKSIQCITSKGLRALTCFLMKTWRFEVVLLSKLLQNQRVSYAGVEAWLRLHAVSTTSRTRVAEVLSGRESHSNMYSSRGAHSVALSLQPDQRNIKMESMIIIVTSFKMLQSEWLMKCLMWPSAAQHQDGWIDWFIQGSYKPLEIKFKDFSRTFKHQIYVFQGPFDT